MESQPNVTRLLIDLQEGRREAFEPLVALMYDDLRLLARRHLRYQGNLITLHTRGLVHEAYLKLAERAGAVSDFLTDLDGQPELQMALQGTMADVYSKLGMHQESKEIYEGLWAKETELYGPESYQATGTRIKVGLCCLELSLFDEAEAHLQACYDIRKDQEPRDPNWLSMPLRSLARVAAYRGEQDKAIQLFEQSFAMMGPEEMAGQDSLGRAYNNYASALSGVGRCAAADSAFAKAETCWLASLHPDHSYFGALYSNWALTKSELGDDRSAEELHRKALALKRKLTHNKVQIGVSLINLGNLPVTGGRPSEGLPLLVEAVAIHRPLLPSSKSRFAETLYELGEVLIQQGQAGAAEAHLTEALAIFVETRGAGSTWARDTRNPLAGLSR